MQSALKGTITEAMYQVAKDEDREPQMIMEGVASGQIVIPANFKHDFPKRGIGSGLKIKINANLGTSQDHCNPEEEFDKLEMAVRYGADSVMDLSTSGNLALIRKTIIKRAGVMVGTVPVYAAMTKLIQARADVIELTSDDLFTEIEEQARDGVDFMTVHAGITQRTLPFLENHPRLTGVVSRGGSFMKKWIKHHQQENPLYQQYDRLLDICEEYDVTLSLGDGLRPGSQADATDRGQLAELLLLGELVERSRARGVQVMVEGPGHIPLNEVGVNILLAKKICMNAPFYVLGPLTTDIAPGYDHIVGAIGAAHAGLYGADFLCYVTPAEHLCLPNLEDVKQGVIASKIAAHSADLAKGLPDAIQRDNLISKARRNFDWETIYNNALDPDLARQRKESSASKGEDHCTMCGELCAVKMDRE